jgi:phosphoribosyl 1,2-cyclic phosphodiesterase
VALYFKTLRSSSSGNCLRLWTEQTNVIIDCGLNSQKLCRALLSQHAGEIDSISAVLISHLHQDHIHYSALRVFEDHGITVRIHERLVNKFQEKFIINNRFGQLNLQPFPGTVFNLGEFTIKPVQIPHSPQHDNYGFVINYQHCARRLKIVIMTDFNNGDGLAGHFADADFIYVEANHNPGLLKKYPNPNSQYHMKNETVADLLCSARKLSTRPPAAVMLGHLSKERNTRELAIAAIQGAFMSNNMKPDFKLYVAPADYASPAIELAGTEYSL